MKPLVPGFLLATASLLAATAVFATAPKLNSTTPAGAQRGTEVEVKLNGSRLEDAQEVVFYGSGIQCTKLDTKTNSVKAHFKIAKDCRLGEHQFRVRTASGVSDLRTFWVGALPEVAEKEPNNELPKAQSIPLNNTITGTAGGEDVDYYQVPLKKGERLSVEIEAIRLGRALLDSYIAIQDTSSNILAWVDDTALLMQDGALTFIPPKDGIYILQVRETSYGGAGDTPYRLHVGTFPRPTAVYPAGGKAGEELEVRFVGDAAGEFKQKVKLPSEPNEKFGVFCEQNGQIAPSPNWVRVSPFPNVLESEPNNKREQATSSYTDLPVAMNGILSKPGDEDWFKFAAKKGQALELAVYARRLRTPVDSVLAVYDSKGNSVASNDDSAGPDSLVKFNVPEDGDYFVRDDFAAAERHFKHSASGAERFAEPAVHRRAAGQPICNGHRGEAKQFQRRFAFQHGGDAERSANGCGPDDRHDRPDADCVRSRGRRGDRRQVVGVEGAPERHQQHGAKRFPAQSRDDRRAEQHVLLPYFGRQTLRGGGRVTAFQGEYFRAESAVGAGRVDGFEDQCGTGRGIR